MKKRRSNGRSPNRIERSFRGAVVALFLIVSASWSQVTAIESLKWFPWRHKSSAAPSRLAFEVASIKADVGGFTPAPGRIISFGCHGKDGPARDFTHTQSPVLQIPIGRCVGTRTDMEMLLESAFDVPSYSGFAISGAPDWFKFDRFAIEAKADDPATDRELHEMLQTLIMERFKLKFHYESKEIDGFGLVLSARGSKLRQATGQEEQSGISMRGGIVPGGGGLQQSLIASNAPLSDFIRFLVSNLKKPVLDRTGLNGNFNFTFGPYSPREMNSDPASVFSLIQEQLGLKIESQKVTSQIFVIDHIEKPTFD
jgi:uncharacterized protein (TIGR03435 family)